MLSIWLTDIGIIFVCNSDVFRHSKVKQNLGSILAERTSKLHLINCWEHDLTTIPVYWQSHWILHSLLLLLMACENGSGSYAYI